MVERSLLLTDLYQLSMLEAYAAHGMAETAVFELFVRKLPPGRGFLMAAGLEQAVQFLETMRFTPDELAWLRESRLVSSDFIGMLKDFRFTGDVDAMPDAPALDCAYKAAGIRRVPEAQAERRQGDLARRQVWMAGTRPAITELQRTF